MKKIFSFFAAILFAGSMMADTYSVTIDQNAGGSNNVHITTTTAESSQVVSYENVSWVAEWTGVGVPTSGSKTQCQFGTGSKLCSTVQFSTSDIDGDITSVKVTTWGAKSTGAKCSVKVGTTDFKKGGKTSVSLSNTPLEEHEFTGSASGAIVIAWEQTTAKAIYVSKIEVTYTPDPNAVAKPTFTPAAEVFEGNLNVKLACSTTGAAIYYTLDGAEPSASSTLYTDAGIDISNTTTIKAIAIKGEEKSSVATKTYTKVVPVSLTDFLTNKPTSEVILKDLTVIYATGKNTYVIDEDGVALVMYDASKTYYDGKLTAGKVLSGQKATYSAYNNQDQIVPTNAVVATDGVAPVPTLMNVAPTADQVNKYISFKNVAAALNTTDSKYYIFDGAIQLYSASTTLKPEADGNYDLAGILINYKGTQLELIVTSLKKSTPTAIDNAEAGVKANKVLRDGVLLIEKNGVLYNAQGAVVR